jgi:hypothetical protein
MSDHPYNHHREYQRGHRRVGELLKGHPDGAMQHATGKAFSNVTSKTAAASHDSNVEGKSSPKRYARGGKVKGATTNIAIVLPGGDKGGMEKMPMGAPPMPMPPPGAGGPPGGPPPGMPMRASGGRVGGESTKENISKMASRAKSNSFFRGGAATGVGREEKAERMKRKGK